MRLPTYSELANHNLLSKLEYGACSNGSSSAKYAQCSITSNCYGASSDISYGTLRNYCLPYYYWSQKGSNPSYGTVWWGLQSDGSGDWNVIQTNSGNMATYAGSVRCVKDP